MIDKAVKECVDAVWTDIDEFRKDEFCTYIKNNNKIKRIYDKINKAILEKKYMQVTQLRQELCNEVVVKLKDFIDRNREVTTCAEVIRKYCPEEQKERFAVLGTSATVLTNMLDNLLLEYEDMMRKLGYEPATIKAVQEHSIPLRKIMQGLYSSMTSEKYADDFDDVSEEFQKMLYQKVKKFLFKHNGKK